MHPYLNSELVRVQQAEIRRQVDQARAARAMLDSSRSPRRITFAKLRRLALITIDVRGWRPA
ncbi:MAG: hypothetical protein HZY75_11520 [Nocardioidaceae bacterium]|nr:MAG: hypothetical protein HZY75_11520 [Nocardioidaceae bacterium]